MSAWGSPLSWETLCLAAALFLAGLGLGAAFVRQRAARATARFETRLTRLSTQLVIERQRHREKLAAMEEARKQLMGTFAALSRRALRENNETFLHLAKENLRRFQTQAEAGLRQKEHAIETLVSPIREALDKTERQIREMEKERREAYGSLTEHLKHMAEAQNRLRLETGNLVRALRRPEVRGQWGELTLRRLAELSGMVKHCDFSEQQQRRGEDGALRPDMVVRMPDAREIIVDAKTPLDAYLRAVEADDDKQRDLLLRHHARKVRERMRELAGKAYWSQFPNAPDFVVLFIPGDQFLACALEYDPALLEDALQRKVILATPTSLVALLRAVAFGWRQLIVAENAEKIRDLGEELHARVAHFTEHLLRLGRSLGNSVEQYNRAVGSLERQVLPGARRLAELGIQTRKDLDEPQPLERAVRMPAEN